MKVGTIESEQIVVQNPISKYEQSPQKLTFALDRGLYWELRSPIDTIHQYQIDFQHLYCRWSIHVACGDTVQSVLCRNHLDSQSVLASNRPFQFHVLHYRQSLHT